MKTLTRRSLMQWAGSLAIATPIAALLNKGVAFAATVYKKADLATEKKNPSVAAFKYVADASQSKDRTQARMNVAADKQTCVNCNFYKNEGTLEGSGDKVGQCLMFQNQVVHGKGWCNIWAVKA